MKHYTSIEQGKKLLELGLSPKSADMYFEPSVGFLTEPSEIKVGDIKYAHPRSIPAWSLSALLELMPKIENETIGTFYPHLCQHQSGKYICVYTNSENQGSSEWFIKDYAIDACYNMVVWLLENNYIKKEE